MVVERKLTDLFIAPPISVLDPKQGYWKKRRKQWVSLGIHGELGRNENLLSLSKLLQTKQKGTSIFDPVLIECMLEWFTAPGDEVLDLFAGGSVRGIVASKTGRCYIGVDVRPEQIAANLTLGGSMDLDPMPDWIVADARTFSCRPVDFLFLCPPYYDLERYSDRRDDLSNMTTEEYDQALSECIRKGVDSLRDDRFGVVVIGDVRKEGAYVNLPGKVIEMFRQHGCHLYNTMVVLQEPVTAAMRAYQSMERSRKIPKAHQNVLVFLKGDAGRASSRLPKIEDMSFWNPDS